MESHSICAVCAWRENCNKKFSLSGKDINCPDYCRDISIRDTPPDKDQKKGQSGH